MVSMRRTFAPTLILMFLSLMVPYKANAQPGQNAPVTSVQGVVLDKDGNPIPAATVYGLPEQDMRKPISTTSDDSGNFVLDGVPVGNVYMHAFKVADGYPDGFYAFFKTNERAWVKVEVKPGQATTGVTIQLGPKAAHLKVAVTDENGKPVLGSFVFDRDEVPGPFTTSAPTDGAILVPPVPFRFSVQADGYEIWHFGGVKWRGKEGLINLKSGETFNISVQLHKK